MYYIVPGRIVPERMYKMFQELLEQAYDFLPLPVFIVQDGFFCYVNNKMTEISGYSREKLLKTPVKELIYPDDRAIVKELALLRAAGKQIPETYQFRTYNPEGNVIHIKGFFSVIEFRGRSATLGQIINVTRPKEIKEQYDLQKVHFQQLLEKSPQAIAMMDSNDRFVGINRSFEELFYYSIDEIKGLRINDVIVPEYLVDEASIFSNTVFGGGVISGETVRKRKDGSLVNVSLIGYPVIYNGKHVGMNAIYNDITERKQAEKKIRESEEKYRRVFENAPLGIFHFDSDGSITSVNDNFANIVGSSPGVLKGLNMMNLPDKKIVLAVKEALSGRIGRYEGEYKSVTAQKVTPVKVDFAPIIAKDNSVIGGVGIVEDITERKRAQDEVFREKERLSVTLSSIGDAVIVVSNDGIITMINPVAQSLTGWDDKEAIGRPLEEVFRVVNEYTGEPILNPVQKTFALGKITGMANHTALIARNGTRRSIADSAAPIMDKSGKMLGVVLVFRDMTEERQKEEALKKSEERFRSIVESTDDWVWEVDPKGIFTYVSPQIKDLLGYSPGEVVGKTIFHLLTEDEARRVSDIFRAFSAEYKPFRSLEFKIFHKEGFPVFMETNGVPFFTDGKFLGYFGIIRDITQRKIAAEELSASRQQLQDIIEFLPDATFVIDKENRIIAWNRAIEEMTGVPKEGMIGKSDFVYSVPFYGKNRPVLIDLIFSDNPEIERFYDYVERKGSTLFSESFVPLLNHKKGAYVWVKASPLFDRDGNMVGAIESIRDITERKKIEEQLKYLSLHDPLTGLYNRAYFEEEMRRLEGGDSYPVSIILCDVDGLKLVNDTLGHNAGDTLLNAAADVNRQSFSPGYMVARIGGDEFAILLPNIDREGVQKYCRRIRENLKRYNALNPDLPLSLSIGFSTAADKAVSLSQLFKEADNNMYREKLHHSQSARSAIVNTLMKALEARDFITEGHADRIQDLVEDIAIVMGLSERNVTELRLFAQFHDIGKVGIPDRILFKPGPLNKDEFNEMKRHCEIGYRIAQSAPDLAPIADWILKHHEWWNGNGYPLGLKGEDIPMECRILSIADAYDAMTSDRPYRKAMVKDQAVAELKRCAGIQFDPRLVEVFVKLLEGVICLRD